MNLYAAAPAERLAALIRRRYSLTGIAVEQTGGGTHAVTLRLGDQVYTLGVETLAAVEVAVWERAVWDGESESCADPLVVLEFLTGADAALDLRAEIARHRSEWVLG